MKTEQIYMLDPYQKVVNATILDVVAEENGVYRLLLDKTVFYPMGGGQPTDQGEFILADGTRATVYQVMIKDGEIWHYVKSVNAPEKTSQIVGELNWERRFHNMKVHSGGHIVDFAIHMLGFSPEKLSPFKGDHGKKPFVQYKGQLSETNEAFANKVQAKVNEIIQNNMQFSWEFTSFEKLQSEAIYLQPNLPTNKPLRILRLEGVGAVADGGTIVKSSSEVGNINITKVEADSEFVTVFYEVPEVKQQQVNTNIKQEPIEVQSNANTPKADFSNLENIHKQFGELFEKAKDDAAKLTEIYRNYLGTEGILKEAMKAITEIDKDSRKAYGVEVNKLKSEIDSTINARKAELNSSKTSEYLQQQVDDLDHAKPKIGHLHPLTETTNDLNKIFMSLGYSVMDGPELETDEFLFQRCNVPLDHPARDLQDSIYVEEPNILLRTQTSSIEAHALMDLKPPFKIVMPGRVYRNEKVNKSNHFTFHQYQLVCVQEKVSLAELIATIDYLFKSYLGEDVVVRYRNKYYPEVEPGVGPDMQCFNCKGEGKKDGMHCAVCKGRGWMEMAGAGIIHPNMMRMAGLDTNKWQGYAFGLGLDRWAMAKHNITDIRTLLGGNLAYRPFVR